MVIGWVCILFSAVGLLSLLVNVWSFGPLGDHAIGFSNILVDLFFYPIELLGLAFPVVLKGPTLWVAFFSASLAFSNNESSKLAGIFLLALLPFAMTTMVVLNVFDSIEGYYYGLFDAQEDDGWVFG